MAKKHDYLWKGIIEDLFEDLLDFSLNPISLQQPVRSSNEEIGALGLSIPDDIVAPKRGCINRIPQKPI